MSPEPDSLKHGRVLACALCKKRRVKCSRTFPCTNCVRAGAQCVQPDSRKRRPRFPERQLLDRLRQYEDLLRQNNVEFTPLHSSTAASTAGNDDDGVPSRRVRDSSEAVDVSQAIKRVALDDNDDDDKDDESDAESTTSVSSFSDADERVKEGILANDHLLFGAPSPDFQLRTSHPDQVQMFRLWQIYLDNVNPLLRVTHTPTLQPRVIDAASDVGNVTPAFETLLFSIYSVAVMSLGDDECQASFRMPRDDLLVGYQIACKQALLKCTPWRSNNIDGLTAFYLYLISVAPQVDPRSLACMVAVAIRTAQRMGLHSERSNSNPDCTASLEAEMRRRLWWALVLFDHRICEIAGQEKSTVLTPMWDCRPPLNANDFEMQVNMSQMPLNHDASVTEALFVVVRSELADFVRHSESHLTIIGCRPPSDVVHSNRKGGGINALETTIKERHLVHCNPEIPLHYMTIWTTRSFIAKCQLIEHYIEHASPSSPKPTNAQRSAANNYALQIIQCDTKLRASPLSKGFLWAVESWYSPVLAYLHVLNSLAKRPDEDQDRAWQAICENYEALINGPRHHRTRFMFALKFSRITLQAWDARSELLKHQNLPPEQPPRLVLDSRENVAEMGSPSFRSHSGSAGNPFMSRAPSLAHETANRAGMPHMLSTSMDIGGSATFADSLSFDFSTSPYFFPEMLNQDTADMAMNQVWCEENMKWN